MRTVSMLTVYVNGLCGTTVSNVAIAMLAFYADGLYVEGLCGRSLC